MAVAIITHTGQNIFQNNFKGAPKMCCMLQTIWHGIPLVWGVSVLGHAEIFERRRISVVTHFA